MTSWYKFWLEEIFEELHPKSVCVFVCVETILKARLLDDIINR